MKYHGVVTFCATCLPVAAYAECTSPNCYNNIIMAIVALIAMAVIAAGLLIALIVLLIKKRWRAAKIVGALLGVLAVAALMLLA